MGLPFVANFRTSLLHISLLILFMPTPKARRAKLDLFYIMLFTEFARPRTLKLSRQKSFCSTAAPRRQISLA